MIYVAREVSDCPAGRGIRAEGERELTDAGARTLYKRAPPHGGCAPLLR